MIGLNVFKKRIDELGRIVIPKEIRKLFKINNFDELDLSIKDDIIIIKKSLGLKIYQEKIKKCIALLNNMCNFDILVLDKDSIIASSNVELEGKVNFNNNDNFNNVNSSLHIGDKQIFGYIYLDKIILDSNLLGYIIFISKEKFSDIDLLKKIKIVIMDLIN